MNKMHLLGFFGSIILVFTFVSIYLFLRGWQAIPSVRGIKIGYTCIFLALTLLPWMARMYSSPVSQAILPIGYTWIIAAVYLTLFALFFDIIRLANHVIPFYPEWVKLHYPTVKWILLSFGLMFISLLLIYGHKKFKTPVIKPYDIELYHPLSGPLNIVAISDLHLGENIGKPLLEAWVNKINGLHPDIVLMAGDITEGGANAGMVESLSPVLRNIQSKYGVYAIPGNHDRYGRQSVSTDDFLKASGVIFLRDSTVCIGNLFYLVGREDNSRRISLDSLMLGLDRTLPVILLDHRPEQLQEAQKHNIDLQISGHTHNGQFWPLTLIVRRMFQLSYGYLRLGNTQYIVTSGLGLWGPPYRIGTQSEIVFIKAR